MEQVIMRGGQPGIVMNLGAVRDVQRGVVLFIALIVLVALSLAGVALVRSVDTSNLIAGNLAFKQGAINAADIGIEHMLYDYTDNAMPSDGLQWATSESLDANHTPGPSATTQKFWYYATRREVDSRGVPTTKEHGTNGAATPIDWSAVPIASSVAGNDVRIVVERLCAGPAPVTDVKENCFFDDPYADGGTKKTHESVFTAASSLYYRITVHASGPRNTVGMVQSIVTY